MRLTFSRPHCFIREEVLKYFVPPSTAKPIGKTQLSLDRTFHCKFLAHTVAWKNSEKPATAGNVDVHTVYGRHFTVALGEDKIFETKVSDLRNMIEKESGEVRSRYSRHACLVSYSCFRGYVTNTRMFKVQPQLLVDGRCLNDQDLLLKCIAGIASRQNFQHQTSTDRSS